MKPLIGPVCVLHPYGTVNAGSCTENKLDDKSLSTIVSSYTEVRHAALLSDTVNYYGVATISTAQEHIGRSSSLSAVDRRRHTITLIRVCAAVVTPRPTEYCSTCSDGVSEAIMLGIPVFYASLCLRGLGSDPFWVIETAFVEWVKAELDRGGVR